jgi:hypothetical protein
MGNMRFSIIFAVIRPEISEKVSVGLIIADGEQLDVRYSRRKLNALQWLFSEKEYRFISKVVSQMRRNKRVKTVVDVDYLARYSNNLIAFSPLQSIELTPTEQNKDRLFKNYVYDRIRQAV